MNMHLKWNCGQGAALAATLVLGALVPCVSAAAEGGGSNYTPGSYGDFGAGMAPQSYLRNDVSFYEAGIGPRPINGGLDPGFEQDLWMDRLTLGGFMDSGSSGAKFGIELQIPYVFDLTVTQNPGGPPFDSFASPRDHAFADPTIKPQIAWGSGPHYGKFSLGIVAPWGTHDDGSVLSAGRHYWSFDPSFSHTYLSESGWDVSTTVGFMINLENHQSGPNYETGDEAHIDALIGKHFGENFALGVAGYWYHQIDDDKGPIPPPLEMGYQGDSTGYGPVIMFGNKNVSLVAKWMYENYADNRLAVICTRFLSWRASAASHRRRRCPWRLLPWRASSRHRPATTASGGCRWRRCARFVGSVSRDAARPTRGCQRLLLRFHRASALQEQLHRDHWCGRDHAQQPRGPGAQAADASAASLAVIPTARDAEAFNVDLSRRRALAVRDYLASRGIEVTQLAVAGYGESQPIADNTTDEGRQQNRRVVLSRTNCQVAPGPQAVSKSRAPASPRARPGASSARGARARAAPRPVSAPRRTGTA